MDELIQQWPPEVTIERIGAYASVGEKEGAGAGAKLIEYAKFAARTRALIKQMQPAIVYSYDPYAFVASLLGRMGGRSTPLIFHLHELWDAEGLPWNSLQRWIVKAALTGTKSADAVVFPEKYRSRYWLQAAGDSRAPIIVPNCADVNYFAEPPDWNATIARRYSAREVVYVGSTGVANGHLEALRAIAMADHESGISLRVIGSFRPEFEATFKALANELGITERVRLDGWIAHDEVTARASGSSVGLSLYKPVTKNLEYMGSASNKLFEYAAMGLPVVVPDRASYRDFLGDAEWVKYADVEEPESIARAINSIFEDGERYVAMSRAARRAFEEQYNYEQVFAPALDRIFELSGVAKSKRTVACDLAEAS
jgi:glycosyltransferase involved in cell wall biosynthesis